MAEPRKWQKEALGIWRKNGKRGVASVVTGAGKTLYAEMCMLAFRGEFPLGRYIIIVPTVNLLDQWYVSLLEDLRISECDIACYSGQEKAEKPGIINLLVINTARKIAPQIASEFQTFLIVDECHRAGSPVNSLALVGNHQATLGISATPEREYDEGFKENIEPVLGKIIYRYDYEQAYNNGIICPFELINVRTNFVSNEEKKYKELTKQAAVEVSRMEKGEGSEDKLTRILQRRASISASAAMRIPVAAKLVERHKRERLIVFHERVDAAESILGILSNRNHSVTVYHSRIGAVLRRDNLKLYRRGAFDVLVSCRALDEGMNVPETTVAVIASSTASNRQRIQRLGRVLRPAPNKKAATIYTIYVTDQEERRLFNEAKKLLDVTEVKWFKGERSISK